MTPICFPFTYISKNTQAALAACFAQAAVFQAMPDDLPEDMQEAAASGVLDVRVPVAGDAEKLQAVLKEYRYWAEVHQGSSLSFFKTRQDDIPLFDDDSAQRIRHEIRRSESGTARPLVEGPDRIFQARTFLCIAQEFDTRHWEVNSSLAAFADMEEELLRELKGEDEFDDVMPGTSGLVSPGDPGVHMTEERVRTWASLAACDTDLSPLFVTDSRAVFELVTDRFEQAVPVLEISGIPVSGTPDTEWQEKLAENLEAAALKNTVPEAFSAPASKKNDRTVNLTVWRVPGISPQAFPEILAGNEIPAGNAETAVLIALLA